MDLARAIICFVVGRVLVYLVAHTEGLLSLACQGTWDKCDNSRCCGGLIVLAILSMVAGSKYCRFCIVWPGGSGFLSPEPKVW